MSVLETTVGAIRYSVVEGPDGGFEVYQFSQVSERFSILGEYIRQQDAINALVNAQTVAIAQAFPRA